MRETKQRKDDPVLIWLAAALMVIGVLVVYDASFPQAGFSRFMRQLVWMLVALGAYAVGKRLPLMLLYRGALTLALVSVILMLAVKFPGIGVELNGAYRWIRIPSTPILLQPSELGKLALIVLLASLLSHPNLHAVSNIIRKRQVPWAAILSTLVMAVIVAEYQSDLGTAVVFMGIGFTILLIAGTSLRYLAVLCCVIAIAIGVFVWKEPYRLQRIMEFTNPFDNVAGADYQLAHSLMGISAGGVEGVGLGRGRAKGFLPAADTDFVFTTIAEETGILGSTLIIFLLAALSWRTFTIARKAQGMFLMLVTSGVGTMLATQSLLNLLVVTGVVPTTGLPLPLISYGGSSLVTVTFSIGLVQHIAQNPALSRTHERESHARSNSWWWNRGTSVSRREYRRGVA